MNEYQKVEIRHPCYFASETAQRKFCRAIKRGVSLVLTVNSGYESIDLGFGGPVWHASVSSHYPMADDPETLAVLALQGVGDASLGEWREQGNAAFHIKRRLSQVEQSDAGLFTADLRNTPAGRERIQKLIQQYPRLKEFALAELGDIKGQT